MIAAKVSIADPLSAEASAAPKADFILLEMSRDISCTFSTEGQEQGHVPAVEDGRFHEKGGNRSPGRDETSVGGLAGARTEFKGTHRGRSYPSRRQAPLPPLSKVPTGGWRGLR